MRELTLEELTSKLSAVARVLGLKYKPDTTRYGGKIVNNDGVTIHALYDGDMILFRCADPILANGRYPHGDEYPAVETQCKADETAQSMARSIARQLLPRYTAGLARSRLLDAEIRSVAEYRRRYLVQAAHMLGAPINWQLRTAATGCVLQQWGDTVVGVSAGEYLDQPVFRMELRTPPELMLQILQTIARYYSAEEVSNEN